MHAACVLVRNLQVPAVLASPLVEQDFQLFEEDLLVAAVQVEVHCDEPGLQAAVHAVDRCAVDVRAGLRLAQGVPYAPPPFVTPPAVPLPAARADEDVEEEALGLLTGCGLVGACLVSAIQPDAPAAHVLEAGRLAVIVADLHDLRPYQDACRVCSRNHAPVLVVPLIPRFQSAGHEPPAPVHWHAGVLRGHEVSVGADPGCVAEDSLCERGTLVDQMAVLCNRA